MKEGLRPEKPGLTFMWHHPYRIPWMLTVFMGLSVLLHAISFYAFQVVYPTATTLRIPAARLTIVDLADPAYFHLQNWVMAENPSHIMSTLQMPEAEEQKLAKVDHKPSFAATSPRLLTPSFAGVEAIPVPGDLFESLALPKRPTTAGAAVAVDLPPVRLVASGDLQLVLAENIELPEDVPTEPLDSMAFLVTVDDRGKIGAVLLVESSGVESADRFAERLLNDARVLNPEEVAGTSAIVHVMVYPAAGRKTEVTAP